MPDFRPLVEHFFVSCVNFGWYIYVASSNTVVLSLLVSETGRRLLLLSSSQLRCTSLTSEIGHSWGMGRGARERQRRHDQQRTADREKSW